MEIPYGFIRNFLGFLKDFPGLLVGFSEYTILGLVDFFVFLLQLFLEGADILLVLSDLQAIFLYGDSAFFQV